MKKFGLACEGITDHIVLKNILCGFFGDLDLAQEIKFKQPLSSSDTTDQVENNGGWRNLLKYLETDTFREDVENYKYMIIQVDTDVSNNSDVKFDVPHHDCDNNILPTDVLINNVITTLITIIDKKDAGFYDYYSGKIIFAISIHSIECWLVAYYGKETETQKCFDVLKTIKLPQRIPVTKKHNGRNYKKLSAPFLKRKNIDITIKKDPSFKHFIQSLEKIPLSEVI
ncbi:MAG: hypothetical protein KAU26_07565 [Methylococcales bacterium]|nr:hypothetical protein [Methylococcales bacterium]